MLPIPDGRARSDVHADPRRRPRPKRLLAGKRKRSLSKSTSMNTSRARSFTAWQQSLDLAHGGHVQYGIRSYIQTRIMTAMQQLREGPLPAEISEVSWLPARPAPTEEVLVTCRIPDGAANWEFLD